LITQLPCAIELPDEWDDFFQLRGQMPTSWNDKRRFPRQYMRVAAALEVLNTFAPLKRSSTPTRIYLKDASRTSVGFLHSEQLFPLERVAITAFEGARWQVEVARCRRIQDHCFEVGGRLVAAPEDDELL
jgi:hypothetical protein